MMDDVEDLLFNQVSIRVFIQQSADRQVSGPFPFLRNQRVGGLLHAIVQESVGVGSRKWGMESGELGSSLADFFSPLPRRQDQSFIDRLFEIIRDLFRRLLA